MASLDAENPTEASCALGKHDLSFDPGEPDRYRADVPNAEVHVLDAGHFALDTKADEIAAIVRQIVSAHVTEVQVTVAR